MYKALSPTNKQSPSSSFRELCCCHHIFFHDGQFV